MMLKYVHHLWIQIQQIFSALVTTTLATAARVSWCKSFFYIFLKPFQTTTKLCKPAVWSTLTTPAQWTVQYSDLSYRTTHRTLAYGTIGLLTCRPYTLDNTPCLSTSQSPTNTLMTHQTTNYHLLLLLPIFPVHCCPGSLPALIMVHCLLLPPELLPNFLAGLPWSQPDSHSFRPSFDVRSGCLWPANHDKSGHLWLLPIWPFTTIPLYLYCHYQTWPQPPAYHITHTTCAAPSTPVTADKNLLCQP